MVFDGSLFHIKHTLDPNSFSVVGLSGNEEVSLFILVLSLSHTILKLTTHKSTLQVRVYIYT